MRKVFSGVLVILLVMIVSAQSFARGGSQNESRTPLRFSTLSEGARGDPVFERMVAHAAQKTNTNIEFEPVPGSGWPDFYMRVMAQIAARDVPDFIRMRTSEIHTLSQNNHIIDLGPRIATLDPNEYYLEYFIQFGGKQVMVPPGIYTGVLYYNKDMFAKAGLPEPKGYDDPWTFDEFRAAALALSSGTGANRVFGYQASLDTGRWAPFVFGNGAGFIDENNRHVVNSPRFKEAMQFIVDLIHKDGSVGDPSVTQAINPRDLFMSGRSAMYSSGQWDLVNFDGATDFEVGVAAWPYNPRNTAAPAMNLSVDGYCILTDSKNHDKSWEAIMALVDETSAEIMTSGGILGWPTNRRWAEANKASLFPALVDRSQLDTLMGLPFARPWGYLDNETNVTLVRFFQLMCLGEMSVEEATESMQRAIQGFRVNPTELNPVSR